MVERLRIAVLFVSDSEHDVTGVIRELRRAGFAPIWQSVDSASPLWRALENRHWDFVVSDAGLPQLDVFDVLALTRELAPSTAFVVLAESMQEEMAVGILRAGAADFVTKGNLPRLSTAIKRELARPTIRAATPAIAAMLVTAQEAEARRIARNLHDGLGQLLAALARTLDEGQLAVARALNDDAIRAVREISTSSGPRSSKISGCRPRCAGSRSAIRTASSSPSASSSTRSGDCPPRSRPPPIASPRPRSRMSRSTPMRATS